MRERGVNASESRIRKWYDLYNRRIPEEEGEAISSDSEGFSDVETAAVSRVIASASDLKVFESQLLVWRHVEGLSVAQVVSRLRAVIAELRQRPLHNGMGYKTALRQMPKDLYLSERMERLRM